MNESDANAFALNDAAAAADTPAAVRFDAATVEALRGADEIRIRAGRGAGPGGRHRATPIWVVVVAGRTFVRSWKAGPRSWASVLAAEGTGKVTVAGQEIPVRAVPVDDPAVRAAVSDAIRVKYDARWPTYVPPFMAPASLDTTTELLPA